MRDHPAGLCASGDRAGGAPANAKRETLRRIGEEHGDQCVGSDDQQGYRKHGTDTAADLEPEHAGEPRDRHRKRGRHRPFSAPPAVQVSDDEDGREGDQRRLGQELARDADTVALGDQVRRQPQQQTEVDEAEADCRKAECEQLAEKRAAGERNRVPLLKCGLLGGTSVTRLRAEALHHQASFFPAAACQQEFRRFRNEGAEQHERQACGQVQYP